MSSARLTCAVAMLFVAAASARGDLALFPTPGPSQYLNFQGHWGTAAGGAETYSVLFQSTGPHTVAIGLQALLGEPAGAANVTTYVPLAGAPVDVGNAYEPAQPSLPDDVVMFGPHLVGGAGYVVADGGVDYLVGDFEYPPGTTIYVGGAAGDLWLHYSNMTALPGPTAMRIWGPLGGTTGRVQFYFDLDQDGGAPSDPPSASGLSLPAGGRIYVDGVITLGTYIEGGTAYQWRFTTALFESDFGAYVDGRIGGWSTVPEPGTLALVGLGAAGLLSRPSRKRVRYCGAC